MGFFLAQFPLLREYTTGYDEPTAGSVIWRFQQFLEIRTISLLVYGFFRELSSRRQSLFIVKFLNGDYATGFWFLETANSQESKEPVAPQEYLGWRETHS